MKISRRIAALAAFGAAATVVAAGAGGPAPAADQRHGPAVVAQASPQAATCVPQRVPGPLPTPRTVDTWTLPSSGAQQHFFTLNVSQSDTLFYCYTVAGDTRPYVEAPSIRVRAGDTFTMALVDQIPPSLAGSTPAPQATTPDKCALLDYEGPMPSANATPGYFGHPRVAATPSHAMMANDTNLHTHGWHVDPDVDNVFKSLAMSANGTCAFTFTIPLSQPPGTYWYHAHLHGISDGQVLGGLAGALIVLPAGGRPDRLPDTTLVIKNFLSSPTGDEHALLLHKYKRIHGLPQPKRGPALRGAAATATFNPFNPPPDVSGIALNDPNYCNTFSDGFASLQVNGQAIPGAIPGASPSPVPVPYLNQAPNTERRYRIINASSDSYVNIRVRAGTAYQKLRVLARDGVPVNWGTPPGSTLPYVVRDNVMLGPSNRVDLLVASGPGGAQQTIISDAVYGPAPTPVPARNAFPFCLGNSGAPMYERRILTVRSAANAAAAAPRLAATAVRELTTTAADRFVATVPSVQNRAITFTEYNDEGGYPQGNFYVTETGSAPLPLPTAFSERPFWLASPRPPIPSPPISFHYLPEITVRKSVTPSEVWTLVNATPEAHTFHIHQLTFVAVVSPWEPTAGHEAVFLDSIALPAGAVVPASQCGGRSPCLAPSITRIKINFGPIHRGTFVYHCHMLFHEDAGMMGIIRVI